MSPSETTFNNLNQIQTLTPGAGKITIDGATNRTATVTVNGAPAQADANNRFTARILAPVSPATSSTLNVTATDASSQSTTKTYGIPTTAIGSPHSYTYDQKGNTLSDDDRTYTWDARGQLVTIHYVTGPDAGASTEFIYNGRGERVGIIEKDTLGAVTSEKRYVWNAAGTRPLDERTAAGVVTRSFFASGEYLPGAAAPADKLYYICDHLGSLRHLVDSSGAVRATYQYDPYGNATKVSGDLDTPVAYTNHLFHARSGLLLTKFRAYCSTNARWLSRDPLVLRHACNLG